MDFLYSLYDALVSINVPSDKARAVVDAMERDMGTTLATKQDLERQTLSTRQDLERQALATRQDLEILKKDVSNRIDLLEQQFKAEFVRLDQKIDTMQLQMTVRLGSMLIVGFGLAIAAMRVWM
jgi:hypothetical protein